jgi:hypothetical protein
VKVGAWIQDRLAQANAKAEPAIWDSRPTRRSTPRDASPPRATDANTGSVVTRSNLPKIGTDQAIVIPPLPASANSPSTQPATTPPTNAPAPAPAPAQSPMREPQKQPPARNADDNEQPISSISDDQAIDRARKLWSRAIDAEQKGDYAEAVRCYEQIKLLPQAAHQAGLDFRLKNAQRLAGQ